jgi:hypothetical protein
MTQTQRPQLQDFVSTSGPAFKPLSKDDVAAILGVSTRTVENWRRDGRIPQSFEIGGRVYWHPELFFAGLNAVLRGESCPKVEVMELTVAVVSNRPPETAGSVMRARKKSIKLLNSIAGG